MPLGAMRLVWCHLLPAHLPLPPLQAVLDFFNPRLDDVKTGPSDWSVARVLELVQSYAQAWRQERLQVSRAQAGSSCVWVCGCVGAVV
jgi:hypothetical protein